MAKTIKVHLDDRKLQEIIKSTEGGVRRRVIADGVNYGIHVELGTSRMAAQPFLIPAFEQHTRGLGDTLGKAIEAGVSLDDVMGKVAFDIQAMAQELAPVDTGALKNSLHVETE
jgi:hypothetical protein